MVVTRGEATDLVKLPRFLVFPFKKIIAPDDLNDSSPFNRLGTNYSALYLYNPNKAIIISHPKSSLLELCEDLGRSEKFLTMFFQEGGIFLQRQIYLEDVLEKINGIPGILDPLNEGEFYEFSYFMNRLIAESIYFEKERAGLHPL